MAIEEGLSGPHLSMAFLCEKILVEKDNVQTFVRVVERFTIPVLPKLPPEVQLPPNILVNQLLQCNMVIGFKAGTIHGGKYHMSIRLTKPDGGQMPENKFDVFLNGSDENGVIAVLPIAISQPEEGLHWFDVYFEGNLITRIPLRVLHQEMQRLGLPR